MKSKDRTAMLVMLALLPLVLVALCYSRLPDQVSLPWSGQETGGKAGLWLWAALGPLLALLTRVVRGRLRRPLETAALVLLLLLDVCTTALAAGLFRPDEITWARMGIALIGLLYLSLGCEEGKWKPNEYMGIRTRWTVADPDVWNRTQRLSGRLMFASGLLILLSSLLMGAIVIILLVFLCSVLCLVVPAVMSRVWYKRLHPPGGPPPDA